MFYFTATKIRFDHLRAWGLARGYDLCNNIRDYSAKTFYIESESGMESHISVPSKIYIDIQHIQKRLSYYWFKPCMKNNHIHPLLPNDFHTYRYFMKFELNWLAQRWCSLKWDNGVFTKLKAGVHMLTKHAKQ